MGFQVVRRCSFLLRVGEQILLGLLGRKSHLQLLAGLLLALLGLQAAISAWLRLGVRVANLVVPGYN